MQPIDRTSRLEILLKINMPRNEESNGCNKLWGNFELARTANSNVDNYDLRRDLEPTI